MLITVVARASDRVRAPQYGSTIRVKRRYRNTRKPPRSRPPFAVVEIANEYPDTTMNPTTAKCPYTIHVVARPSRPCGLSDAPTVG